MGPIEGVRRICVLRGGGLGDLVFALPALEALRAAYPDAEIALLGRTWLAELVDGRTGPVDRFVRLPEVGWIGGRGGGGARRALEELAGRLARESFDLAVQLHGGGRHSNPFVRSLDARVSIGLQAPDAVPLERTVPYVYYQSEVMRGLEVVSLAGAEPVDLAPRYRGIRSADRKAVTEILEHLPRRGEPLAVIQPSASDPRRRWPAESFAAVGDALRRAGATVVLTGDSVDGGLVREVLATMHESGVDLSGRLGLGQLAALLAEAEVVVGNDSGPLHLAAAVGAPTVGVFWCGNLINAGPFTRARHRPVLSWRLDCPVCGVDCTRGSCGHTASFVADAPVHEVIDAALDLLAAAGRATVQARAANAPVAV